MPEVLEYKRTVRVNQTLICLISKVKLPQKITDLRPISLCNALVRIFFESYVESLISCLGALISNKQSAFLEGVTDYTPIAFKVNHYMK